MNQHQLNVSVVIPVYNREMELRRALLSVLAQTVSAIDVLVVDDCSEIDLNALVIEPLNDSRIRFFRLEKKGYANVCRNLGIREAQGEFIAMLDSDDEWLPEHLEKRIEYLIGKEVHGLFGSHYVDNGFEKTPVVSRKRGSHESMADYLLTTGTAATPTHFYRAYAAKQILWDENLKRHQDYDFAIRFAAKFRFEPFEAQTCIVHWAKGVTRDESLQAQIDFIAKHRNTISPKVYNQYHNKAFFQALQSNSASPAVIHHFKRESYRYPDHLTLVDYLTVVGYGKSRLMKLFLRVKYCLLVLVRI